MQKFKVNVAKTPEGYCATMDALEGWIVGVTGNFADLQREVKESIEFYVECAIADGEPYPKELENGDYELECHFDVESLLHFYRNIISRAALSRLTGINERQLGHYICGRSRPQLPQRKKIATAFHTLGRELQAVCV